MDDILSFLKTPEGQGLLSGAFGYAANAKKGTPWNNAGRGGLTGLLGYNTAIDQQQQNEVADVAKQFRNAQMTQMQQEQEAKRLQQEKMTAFRSTLPPEAQSLFDIAPKEYIGTLPMFQKPQLVETADPNEPLRTQKVWMRPGETNGPVAGYGAMPELLDQRIRAAKEAIAAKGASRVNVNSPYEPQFNKELASLDAKALDGMRGKADAGNQMLGSLTRLRELNPKVYANGGAEAKMAAANILAGIGINVGDPNKLAQSQEFDALSSKLVMDALGGSLGTGVSNADVIFLKKTVPNIGHDSKARDALINFMEKKAKSQVETYGNARSYAESNNGLRGWTAPNFVDTSGIPPAAINELKLRKGDKRSREQFDETFGSGAADRILGGK